MSDFVGGEVVRDVKAIVEKASTATKDNFSDLESSFAAAQQLITLRRS
mgnify:CR=1 FL=1